MKIHNTTDIPSGLQTRDAEEKYDTRAYYVPDGLQIRAVGDDGIFEGHAVVWGVVDSKGTRFLKGSFTKTLAERSDEIKILNQHIIKEPIGKPLEMREDDIGLFVRGQLTEGVTEADQMRIKIDKELIDSLSIGFNITKSKPNGAVTDITEAKLFEFSPVTFPSNPEAKILNYRSEDFAQPDNDPVTSDGDADDPNIRQDDPPDNNVIPIPQVRATDFGDTVKAEELWGRRWLLMDSLSITLSDIWWSDGDKQELIAMADTAIADFHRQYLSFMDEFIENFWEQRHEVMADKELGSIVNYELRKADETVETMASKTSFTVDELRALSRGQLMPLESRQKLAELSESIQAAHQEKRNMTMESLCNELRSGGVKPAEAARLKALLSLNDAVGSTEHRSGMTTILTNLKGLRESVTGSADD